MKRRHAVDVIQALRMGRDARAPHEWKPDQCVSEWTAEDHAKAGFDHGWHTALTTAMQILTATDEEVHT